MALLGLRTSKVFGYTFIDKTTSQEEANARITADDDVRISADGDVRIPGDL